MSVVLSHLLKKLGHLAYIDENKSKTKCLLGVYHSNSPAELKEQVRKSFKNDDGPIRVVIATSALSLGVNFKDISMSYTMVLPQICVVICKKQAEQAGMAKRQIISRFPMVSSCISVTKKLKLASK